MVQNFQSGPVVNLGSVPIGEPIRSPFIPNKHLETNSFSSVIPSEHRWLGIINTLNTFRNVKMPFLSMTELSQNTIEVDGPGSVLEFAVPFKTGYPYLLEALTDGNPTPGKYNQPFFLVLSTNEFTYGDVLTTDYRNGQQVRVQSQIDKGPEAEIIEYGNGYRYMVALDSFNDDAYYSQDFLEEGTIYIKIDNVDYGEFGSGWTSVGGGPRYELQPYAYTVGHSEIAIQSWVTADASRRQYSLNHPEIPALAHLKGASTDVLNYFFKDKAGKIQGAFWVPELIEKMAAELAKTHEKALMWQQGTTFVSNGREKIRRGLGFYPTIKQRGNYNTYANDDQLFDLVLQTADRLFTLGNDVPLDQRLIKLRAGTLAYTALMRKFKDYFRTDNPFTVMADHPALLKADMLTYSDKTGILYRPLQFKAIFFPDMGQLILEQDTSLDNMDDYLEHPKAIGNKNLASGMIIIEDISSPDFTNAIPTALRQEGKSYKNVSLIKQKGFEDGIDFLVGQRVSKELKQLLGLPKDLISSQDKKLEISMWTHGELFVQDPSRCWIIEFDPYGDIEFNNRNISLYQPL